MCVGLRAAAAKRKAGAAGGQDSCFQVSVYLDSSLPEFVVKKAVFEQSCKIKPGARVKMWFATVETQRKGKGGAAANGTWYHGSVVNNVFAEDGEPWECVVVRWDRHEELTRVCPWELTLADGSCAQGK